MHSILSSDIFDLLQEIDFVYSPLLVDLKHSDPIGQIDAAIIEGGIRNEGDVRIAKMLRKKAKFVVALGTCAAFGGIHGLGNLFGGKEEILEKVYRNALSVINPNGNIPSINVPSLTANASALNSAVKVDFVVPGCPPQSKLIEKMLPSLLSGETPQLPSTTVCDECKLKREKEKVSRFKRLHEDAPDLTRCFLEQGYICLGPATRGGCRAACTEVGMPCRGCYGPPEGSVDQGRVMAEAIANTFCVDGKKGSWREISNSLAREVDVDMIGLFYRFTLPKLMKKTMSQET